MSSFFWKNEQPAKTNATKIKEVSMKLKNLLTGAASETIYKADDKFDVVILARKNCTYSYFADPMYVILMRHCLLLTQ